MTYDAEKFMEAVALISRGVPGIAELMPPELQPLAANAVARDFCKRIGLTQALGAAGIDPLGIVAAPDRDTVFINVEYQIDLEERAKKAVADFGASKGYDARVALSMSYRGRLTLTIIVRSLQKAVPYFASMPVPKGLTAAQRRAEYKRNQQGAAGSKLARKASKGKL